MTEDILTIHELFELCLRDDELLYLISSLQCKKDKLDYLYISAVSKGIEEDILHYERELDKVGNLLHKLLCIATHHNEDI